MQSYSRSLIDHHKSFTVREEHELFRIGIVRGAEGVGTNPLQQIQVFHIKHFIKSAPMHMGVLMFPKALKIERLPIDEKLPVLDSHSSHAERLLVGIETLPVLPQFYHTGIHISRAVIKLKVPDPV